MLLGGVEGQIERESGFLFPNDFLILDEAHSVEQTASRQIGTVISQYLLRATVQRLYNARSRKGLFTVTRDAEGVRLAAEIVEKVDQFFDALGARCDFRKGREFRVRGPEIVPDTITGRLIALQSRVTEVVKRQDDDTLKSELQELGRRLFEARRGIQIFLEQSARDHVYWAERTGKVGQLLTLNAAPIDIAPALRQILFRDGCTCIMTSATLGVGRKDLAYFRTRVGAEEAEPLQLGSPFNFNQQMKLFVVRKMPDPREDGYEDALEHWIEHFVGKTDGHAFVLFTNYRAMQELAGRMENFCAEHAISFAILAYGSAYLKAHRPAEFYASLINNQPMGFYTPATIVKDARRHGVKVKPVCVVQSEWNCTVIADDTIRLGFCVVNGLQREHADDFLRERNERPFASLDDFRKRAVLTKDELRRLANLGALNYFAEHRRAAMWRVEETPHDICAVS